MSARGAGPCLARFGGERLGYCVGIVPSTERQEAVKQFLSNPIVRTAGLFVALFAIGFATRMPAWQFPHIYALHGVLAAPFCAALAAWHLVRGGSVVQLVAATALLAVVLGMMSPAMGLSFVLVAALTLAVRACLRSVPAAMRSVAVAAVFGALDYPCALAVGLALGSYGPSAEALPMIALLLALSVALSLFGAFVAASLADRRSAKCSNSSS